MRPADPQGGGYSSPGILSLLDVSNAAYVKGLWEGYRDALVWAQKHAGSSVPTQSQWDGDRAERFRSWWAGANADLDRVASGLTIVINALEAFILSASQVNDQLANIEYLIRSNCQYVWADQGTNTICGTFTVRGTPYVCRVAGITMSPIGLPETESPPWLQAIHSYLYWAAIAFLQASDTANEYLRGAMACFTSMHRLKHLDRSSAPGDGPFAGDDPTWQQLTGGGVFRMPLPGFTTDPFGTKLMPAWYDPTTAQKVSTWIGDHQFPFDAAAFLLALAGQPELGVGLELLVHGTKLALDVTDGNTGEIPWDAADLIVDGATGFTLGDLADALTGDVIYQAQHAAESSLPRAIKGALGSVGYQAQHAAAGESSDTFVALSAFVASRLKQFIQEQVGADGKTYTVIPPSALTEVAAEAEGEYQMMVAAHLPPSMLSSS